MKTRNTIALTLAAGIAIGGMGMGYVISVRSPLITPAYAQTTPISAARLAASSAPAEDVAALKSLDSSFANLAEFVAPAVVDIKAVTERKQGPNGERVPVAGGQGSGFIFRKDGWIMTNDHVVGGFDKVTVSLRDGREFPGKVFRSPENDIAVVKIEAKDLPTLALSDSARVRPGQLAMAMGAPLGLDQTVTVGHISAVHRADQIIQGKTYADLIQTDTAINMGNSGGPLVNIDGQVIGINSAIYSPSGASAGIGFAIPANTAQLISEKLVNGGKAVRSYLGIVPTTVKEFKAKELGISGGAVLEEVASDGPAAKAGLRKGDVVTKVDGRQVLSGVSLRMAMYDIKPGQKVEIEYLRDGKAGKATATPSEAPKPAEPKERRFQMPKGLFDGLGDEKGARPREFRFPFPEGLDDEDQDGIVPNVPSEGKPRLGVNVSDISDEMRRQFQIPKNTKGAIVAGVIPGSIASNLGLRPGDVITELAGKPVTGGDSLVAIVKDVKKGVAQSIKVSRYAKGARTSINSTVTF
ncbi:PDZ domain-containing protein [bacterium]|nr:MAG: PDZ domain-containing protein [bacterium]